LKADGVSKDAKQAVAWLRKSADQGCAKAQHDLGVCYENGFGVPRDETEAAAWFSKAAAQGDRRTNMQFETISPVP